MKLHQKLGKPIPADALASQAAADGVGAQPNVAAAVPAAASASSKEPKSSEAPVKANENEDEDQETSDVGVEPIGREYIETKVEGKIT